MKKYYVNYYNDFANTYSLCWADNDHPLTDGSGWDRITRKEAEALARRERQARQYDRQFAFNADGWIYPADLPEGVRVGDRLVLDGTRYDLVSNGYIADYQTV